MASYDEQNISLSVSDTSSETAPFLPPVAPKKSSRRRSPMSRSSRHSASYSYNDAPSLELRDVLIHSNIAGPKIITDIEDKFNMGKDNCFTESFVRGDLIEPDEVLLATFNNQPEIKASSQEHIARQLYIRPGKKVKLIGTHKITELCFGAKGSYVLNVPEEYYAKALINNNGVIYGPGSHVIHDPLFKIDKEKALIKRNLTIIQHGHIVIINYNGYVNDENKDKNLTALFVRIADKGYVLKPRQEPYVFKVEALQFGYKFFNPADDIFVEGSFKRILLKPNTSLTTYEEGKQIKYDSQDEALVITNVNHSIKPLVTHSINLLVKNKKKE